MQNDRITSDQFLRDIMDASRETLSESIKETRSLERYALVLAAAVWSWAVGNWDTPVTQILLWVPAFSTFIFGLRAMGHYSHAKETEAWLLEYESKKTGEENWKARQTAIRYPPILRHTAFGFWVVLQVVTLIVPIVFAP